MNCTDFQNLASLSFADEITPKEKELLLKHIDECSSCKNYYLTQNMVLTHQREVFAVPKGLNKKILMELPYHKKSIKLWPKISYLSIGVAALFLLFFTNIDNNQIHNQSVAQISDITTDKPQIIDLHDWERDFGVSELQDIELAHNEYTLLVSPELMADNNDTNDYLDLEDSEFDYSNDLESFNLLDL